MYYILLVVLLINCNNIILAGDMAKNSTGSKSSVTSFYLDDESIENLSSEAIEGNKDAAFKLYQYHLFVTLNVSEELKWLEIAAKNNHPIAQYNLALYYLQKDDLSDALKWALKAKDNGVHKADQLIERIKGMN